MTGIAAVGVHYDLTSRQTRVAVRAADHEASRRIDEELGLIVHKLLGQNRIKHVFFNILVNLLLRHVVIVLGRKHNRLQANRLAGLVVLNGHLTLAVGS